jgi:hypothetical protein
MGLLTLHVMLDPTDAGAGPMAPFEVPKEAVGVHVPNVAPPVRVGVPVSKRTLLPTALITRAFVQVKVVPERQEQWQTGNTYGMEGTWTSHSGTQQAYTGKSHVKGASPAW